MRINGQSIDTIQNQTLKTKVLEPTYILGLHVLNKLDIRVRVSGGGFVAQAYAIRQAIAKAVVAFHAKISEVEAAHFKAQLLSHDRTLLVADPRRCESKHAGGRSARAKQQKSYR